MSPFRRHFQLHSNNAIIRFLLPIDTIDYKFRLLQPAKQFMKKSSKILTNNTGGNFMHTMMQVCRELNITYRTLKYYCNEGLVPGVKRDGNNRRIFDEKDAK